MMKRYGITTSCLALSLCLWGGPAMAQTSPEEDRAKASEAEGDIVVTAQRRSESLLAVPLAVSAISGDDLVNRRIITPTALSSVVPNLQVNDQTGGNQPNFTLRGIGLGNEYNDNQLSPIGFYVDDAYVVSRGAQGGQFYDLERVEVLRGPQGTLYGRNTTGGAVNIITRRPRLTDTQGYAEIGYGNYDERRAQGALEVTPVEGVLGIRISGDAVRRDAYYENLLPGQPDILNANVLSGRAAIRLKPSEKLDINLRLFAQRSKNWQPASYAIGVGPDGVNPITGYNRSNLDWNDIELDTPRRNRITARGAQLTVNYELTDSLSVQSLSYYDRAELNLGQDVDGSPINLLNTYFDSIAHAFSQEIRLSYDSEAVQFQAGGYYGWDRIRVANRYEALGFLRSLGAPPDPTFQTGGVTVLQNYTQIRRSKAVFGQADISLSEPLTLTLGLRYTEDTGRYRGTAFFADYDFVPLFQTIGTPTAPYETRGSNSALTGRAAIEYELPDSSILYASYSRGYRAGSFNGAAYISPDQVTYIAPERLNAYEIGVKGRVFGGSTTVAASAFRYDYSNQQLTEIRGAGVIFLFNAGKSSLTGIEAEITSRLSPSFTLRASGGYLDGKFDSLLLDGVDLAGNQLPFSPEFTGSVGFDWTFLRSGNWQASFSPTVNATSRIFFNPQNQLVQSQDAYALVDASVTVENGPYSISFWGRNLTQKRYFVNGQNLAGFGFQDLYQGNPRTFGVRVRASF